MSPSRLVPALFPLFSVFLLTPVARAQVANVNDTTSTPIEDAGHDYIHLLSETVNPANGSVSLRIQVPMPKGRGISIPFSFTYDSNSVHHLEPGFYPNYGRANWMSNDNTLALGGWGTSLPMLGSNQWEADTAIVTGVNDGNPVYTIYPCYYESSYVLHDLSGGAHALNLGSVYSYNPPPGGCSGAPAASGGDAQVFGTLPTSQQTVFPSPINVYDAAGTLYYFTSGGTQGSTGIVAAVLPSYIEDRNGNKIIPAQSGSTFTMTDTLGRQLITINGFGPSGATNTITLAGLTYQVSWKTTSANFSVPYTWAGASQPGQGECSGIPQANDSRTVVSQITLPNGKSFNFYYGADNPDPNFQNPYGLLSEIDYPTGGWVKYTWKLSDTMNEVEDYPGFAAHAATTCGGSPTVGCPYPIPDGCIYQYKTPVVASRQVGFGGSSTAALIQTFTYSTTWDSTTRSWTQKNTSITTTDNVTGKTALTTYAYAPIGLPNGPFNYTTLPAQVPVEATTALYDWGNTTTPLRTVNKTWYDQFNLASQQTVLETGQTSKTTYCYVGSNCVPSATLSQLQETDEYDFGASSPTRKTITTYQSFSGTPGIIADAPCKVVTQNGSSNTVAETDYLYDGGTSVCGTAGTPSVTAVSNLVANTHDETLFGSGATTSRGNPTKITHKCLQGCSDSTSMFAFDETGQVITKVDACGNTACGDMTGTSHTTIYSYADNYDSPPSGNTNAYLTQITDPLGHTSKFKYAYSDGQLIQSQGQNDINAQRSGTSYSYNDSLRRLKETDYPDGGKGTISYNDVAPSPSITTAHLITASPSLSLSNTTIMDGLGHVKQTQLTTDPDGADFTDISYDGLGRVYCASNPYRTPNSAGLGNFGSTDGITTTVHDALGRFTAVQPPDYWTSTSPGGPTCPSLTTQTNAANSSNFVSTSYTGNCTTVADQAGKARKSCSDGLGRLIQVIEDPAGVAYETDYAYDALDNLLCVAQKGSNTGTFTNCSSIPASWRPRLFAYDSLSRLTSATNPESGTITYSYDANGNLASKISPAPNQTGSATVTATLSYDTLNRLTQKSFSNGTTPTIKYGYDGVALTGCSVAPPALSDSNPIGRRTSMCDGAGAESWSHDQMGRILSDSRTTNGVTKATGYAYNLDGSLYSLSYPGTTFGVTYAPGGAGRPLTELHSSGWYVAASVHYTPNGSMCSMFAGWGQTFMHNFTFNNRLQPINFQGWDTNEYTTAITPCSTIPNQFGDHFDLSYVYTDASGHNDGNVQQMNNNLNMAITQLYTYDSFNRLATAETLHQNQPWWSGDSPTGACWSEQYTYDAWGNMSAIGPVSSAYTGCTQESLSMTPTIKNQLQDTNNDFVYDAAGNLIQPGPTGGPYVFDAENHLISAGGMAYLYDGDGKRVGKAPASTPTQPNYLYWYGDGSQILLETDGAGNFYYSDFYFNGRLFSRDEADWVDHFYTDALGNVRQVYGDGDPDGGYSEYYPFGGERPIPTCCPNNPGGVNVPFKFTGKERDSETGLDNFGARFDSSSFGRFMSADGPFSDQNKENPQSWNLYTYARNNPLRFTDADGRACVQQEDGSYKTVGTEGQSCEDAAAEEAGDTHIASAVVTPSHDDQIKMFAEDIGNIGTAELKQDVLIMAAGAVGVAADTGIGILGGRAAVARGGIAPVLKGAAGVARAEAEVAAEGGQVLGKEITIENSAGRARADLVYRDANGNLVVGEAKNGPTAAVNPNQKAVYAEFQKSGGQFVGGNARQAGLPQSVGPTQVRVFKY